MVRRLVLLAVAASIAGAGCSAGPSGGLKRSEPPLAKETLSKTRIIAQHNKNAAAIRSLRADPSILFDADGQEGGMRDRISGKLSGRMAMDRPKDFRLEIAFHRQPQADIGSNDQGFWFWVNEKKDPAIYVCDYEHLNASPLTVTMQPEWIMEAMGLREITEREAATIVAKRGDKPGQLVLTQLRKDSKGQTLTKLTVVDESTGEIREHRLYAGAEKELLARATIGETQHIKLEPTEEDRSGAVVSFPSKIKLEWVVEKFKLDITMGQPTINPQFSPKQRTVFFTEPTIAGAKRQNLASLGGSPAAPSSFIHESSPRSGIRLGKPEAEPMDVEGAMRPSRAPMPLVAELSNPPARPSGVVGAPIPRATDPEAVQATDRRGWGRPMGEQ